MLRQKAAFFLSCACKRAARTSLFCPSCGGRHSALVDKKCVVAELRRCGECKLLHLVPTSSERAGSRFYQKRYSQGFTTELPSAAQLNQLLDSSFRDTEKNYDKYVDVLRSIVDPGSRILDFGCSWGYGSWQLARAGFTVEALEISAPRAAYARENLAVSTHTKLEDVRGTFDVFFSSHVLEHVPSVRRTIRSAFSMLREGGYFVGFTPNGSSCYRRTNPQAWHKAWGSVHPNFLDEVFYASELAGKPVFLSSSPYPLDELERWALAPRSGSTVGDLGGPELLVVAENRADVR